MTRRGVNGGTLFKENVGTKRHILDAAEKLLSKRRSSEIRVADVSTEANVAVKTIYYHFSSLGHLIAEAQASAYLRSVEPLHGFLLAAENAAQEKDEQAFWEALGDDIMLVWTYGFGGDRWRTPKQLMDVWADPDTKREFCKRLDEQFERWVNVIESAKLNGWINLDLDTYALMASCWSASLGQAIFSGTSKVHYTPETVRDFWLEIARAKS